VTVGWFATYGYQGCGCTILTLLRQDIPARCPRHGDAGLDLPQPVDIDGLELGLKPADYRPPVKNGVFLR
jgi:hypothetical protein